jgi:hypothetical protein
MAFDLTKLNRVSSGQNTKSFTIFSYLTTDTRATVEGTGYFNDANDGYTGNGRLMLGDLIIVERADAVAIYRITALTPNITLTQLTGDKYKGTVTTTSGSATQTTTVSGVTANDRVFAQLKTVGATPRTILTATCGTNTVTVVFSGDPGNDHVFCYQVI